MSDMMKAVHIFEHGDVGFLRFDDYPMPTLADDGMSMRVLAARSTIGRLMAKGIGLVRNTIASGGLLGIATNPR